MTKKVKLLIVFFISLLLVVVIIFKGDRELISEKFENITKEEVKPTWNIPEWAKERCDSHFIVLRCNINLFMEIDQQVVVDKYGNYRDYNGNYLARACGPYQSSECDFYDENCDNLNDMENKIICNKEYW